MNEKLNKNDRSHDGPQSCPECAKEAMREGIETQTIAYGSGDEAAALAVEVPVWVCEDCGFAYTAADAEVLRHEAICRHLGVLTPREIRAVRDRHHLTRAEFVRLTSFGEASIKRWESGALVQSQSADKFIRLIDDRHTLERLRHIVDDPKSGDAVTRRKSGVFRTTHSVEQTRRAQRFELCSASI
jgi:putative zinc finger/helix-turn-helix YgiT family protein